jgi:hypothetical protein
MVSPECIVGDDPCLKGKLRKQYRRVHPCGNLSLMMFRCGINIPEPRHTMLCTRAAALLDARPLAFKTLGLRTREHRYKHRTLDGIGHTHSVSYVPISSVRFYALTQPWRGQGLISVPVQAIKEAEQRDDLCDKLFVLWAKERNARCLHQLLRLARFLIAERCHWLDQANHLRELRLRLQHFIIVSIRMPVPWRTPRRDYSKHRWKRGPDAKVTRRTDGGTALEKID